MPTSTVNPSINPAIHARLTALLFRNARMAQLITVLAAMPTAYLGYISRPGPVILLWLLGMVLSSYSRFHLTRRYLAASPAEAESEYWARSYIRLVGVQSFLWIAGCGAIMWGNTDSYRFLVVLVLAGMVAGALPILSAFKSAFRIFAVPIVIGTVLITFADATAPVHYVLGVTLLIFLGGVSRSSVYFNDALLESITVALEKSHLVRKAEAAALAKNAFLANISHEIRTPMNSILGMAQLAYKGEQNLRQREYLRKIQSSGEHLLGIIDDILDISRIDAGKLSIEVVNFELSQVIEMVSDMVTRKAEEKRLRLTFEIDPSVPPFLLGDPRRLCQVLTNLADNAIKFTEKGEVIIRVKRRGGERSDSILRFEVQDTGVGLSRDEIPLLFQPFQQLDCSLTRKHGGTGLGLVICKQLVEMMDGGKIGVESFPEVGSTFWFTLKLTEGVRPAEQPLPESVRSESGVLKKIQGARILLVDDNAFNLDVALDFLQGAGAAVTTCSNGEEAIALLHQQHFDCVLMDVQMPVMDGVEAVQLIRKDPAINDVRVIALTANASKEDKTRYLAAGMDDVLIKPYKFQTLFTTIARWLPQEASAGEVAEGRAIRRPASEAAKLELKGDPDIIDLSVLAETTGTDHKKLAELARKFVAALHKDMADIEKALALNDLPALGKLGHYCKTPARTVGAIGFANLCLALEHSAQEGDIDRVRDNVERLRLLPAQIEAHIAKVLP